MVKAIYIDRKGIYKDLYRTIGAENNQEIPAQRQRKGIYANLYRQIEQDKNEDCRVFPKNSNVSFKGNTSNENYKITALTTIQNAINFVLSRVSSFFTSAASEFKFLILACMIAKKPINSYIENSIPVYQEQKNRYNGVN